MLNYTRPYGTISKVRCKGKCQKTRNLIIIWKILKKTIPDPRGPSLMIIKPTLSLFLAIDNEILEKIQLASFCLKFIPIWDVIKFEILVHGYWHEIQRNFDVIWMLRSFKNTMDIFLPNLTLKFWNHFFKICWLMLYKEGIEELYFSFPWKYLFLS